MSCFSHSSLIARIYSSGVSKVWLDTNAFGLIDGDMRTINGVLHIIIAMPRWYPSFFTCSSRTLHAAASIPGRPISFNSLSDTTLWRSISKAARGSAVVFFAGSWYLVNKSKKWSRHSFFRVDSSTCVNSVSSSMCFDFHVLYWRANWSPLKDKNQNQTIYYELHSLCWRTFNHVLRICMHMFSIVIILKLSIMHFFIICL